MEDTLDALRGKEMASKPVLFELSKAPDRTTFEKLIADGSIKQISDDYEEEQRELFGVKNPSKVYAPGFKEAFQEHFTSLSKSKPLSHDGRWVYYPWRYLAAHILPEEEYRLVRTARNQNLITKEEQEKFYNACVGIAGLSVGSSLAFALALSGGAKKMKLADMDRLALSNTNRILAGTDRLGMLKVEMAARTIYELNPYAEIELFSDGLTPDNIGKFFDGLDIVADEIDNLAVKCLIREEAKKRRIAVVMGADNGDNAVIDIERHDLDANIPYFHGRIGDVSYDSLKNLDKFGIGKTITKLVGPENVTERMQQSLTQMGKTIVSWPQLGIAAMVNGAALTMCIRRILNGQPIENNRALIYLDEKLIPGYNTPESVAHRQEVSNNFAKGFGL